MRDWITQDLGWKLFSIFLALVIWLTVHKIREEPARSTSAADGVTLTYDNMPVQIVSTTMDVHDYQVRPNAVAIKVSGTQEVIGKLQANQVHAMVDLTGIAPAMDARQVVEVSAPPGVTVVSVEPTEVSVLPPPKKEVSK